MTASLAIVYLARHGETAWIVSGQHVFPGYHIGARNNLVRWLHLRKPLDYGYVMRIVDRWKPFQV
jgi:hypothetical protein